MRRLHAYALLGWHFLLHWLKKLFFLYRPGGVERVRQNFESEGLTPLTADERRLLSEWQSCIDCGLCEAVCPELGVVPEQRQMGPALLAQSGVRDLSAAPLTLPSTEALRACDDERLQAICPVGIPLVDLRDFLVRLGKKTEAARSDAEAG